MAPQLSTLSRFPGFVRVATLLLSLIGLIFIIVAVCLHRTGDFIGYEVSFYDSISITTFCWTLCWSISAICVLLFHGPYHPGIDIGLDFIGMGLGWGFGILVIWCSVWMNYPADCQYSYQSSRFCTRAKTLMAMEILAGLLAMFYGACHLWMIVEAVKSLMAKRRAPRQRSLGSSEQA